MLFTLLSVVGALFGGFVLGYGVRMLMDDGMDYQEDESEKTRRVEQIELQELLESDHEYIEAEPPEMVPRERLDAAYAEIAMLKARIEEMERSRSDSAPMGTMEGAG